MGNSRKICIRYNDNVHGTILDRNKGNMRR